MYQTKKSNKKLWYRSKYFLAVVLALVLVGSVVTYAATKDPDPAPETSDTATDTPATTDETINLDPPTDEEKQETDNNKDDISNDTPPPPPATTPEGKQVVTPSIARATRTEVSASIQNLFEEGGTCTATASGPDVRTATSESTTGFYNTVCTMIFDPVLSAGDWNVIVSYSSSTAEGTSTVTKVQ